MARDQYYRDHNVAIHPYTTESGPLYPTATISDYTFTSNPADLGYTATVASFACPYNPIAKQTCTLSTTKQASASVTNSHTDSFTLS